MVSVRGILEHFWKDFLRERRCHFLHVGVHSSALLGSCLGLHPLLDAGHMGVNELYSALEELMVSRWRSHTQKEGDQRVIGSDGGPRAKWPSRFRLWSQADLGSNTLFHTQPL